MLGVCAFTGFLTSFPFFRADYCIDFEFVSGSLSDCLLGDGIAFCFLLEINEALRPEDCLEF